MKHYLFPLVAAACISAASPVADASAANKKLLGTGKSELYWDAAAYGKCQQTIVEKYTRFALHDGGKNESSKQFLIKQDFEVGTGCFEGYSPAKIAVSASAVQLKKDGASVSPKTLWRFEEIGNAGRIGEYPLQNLYLVTLNGCCGTPDETKYYSLLSGRLVAPTALVALELADLREVRFISVGVTCSKNDTAQATVYYADENGVKQKLVLDRPLKGCAWRANDIQITPGKKEKFGTTIFNLRSFDGIRAAIKLCPGECLELSWTVDARIEADAMKITNVTEAQK